MWIRRRCRVRLICHNFTDRALNTALNGGCRKLSRNSVSAASSQPSITFFLGQSSPPDHLSLNSRLSAVLSAVHLLPSPPRVLRSFRCSPKQPRHRQKAESQALQVLAWEGSKLLRPATEQGSLPGLACRQPSSIGSQESPATATSTGVVAARL